MAKYVTHEVVTEDAVFTKVTTSRYGGLRFKTSKEDEAVSQYAAQISTDREKFDEKKVREMSGFGITKVKDKQRCLRKISQKASSKSSSTESSTK